MRKTVPFILSMALVSGPMIQAAAADRQEHSYAATLANHEERKFDDSGFSGRDSSRPGGENPNSNPLRS
jgi:hypothetical protein